MGGILTDLYTSGYEWIGLVLFALPVGLLWAVTLIGTALMTARELWLGRRRKKHRRKEFNP